MPRTSTLFDPLTSISWAKAFWADDPDWKQKPANGQPVSMWRNGGTDPGHAIWEARPGASPLISDCTYTSNYAQMNNRGVVYTGLTSVLVSQMTSSLTSPFSIVAIGAQLNAFTDTRHPIAAWTTSQSGYVRLDRSTSPPTWYFTSGSALATRITIDTLPHLIVTVTGSSAKMLVDGKTGLFTGNVGSNSAVNLRIGHLDGTATQIWDGVMGFIGIVSGDVTQNAQWSSFKKWASSYYGIDLKGAI